MAEENSTSNLMGWLFFVAIFVFVMMLGSPMTMKCSRAEGRGPVNCAKQMRLLWVIPLTEEIVYGVQGARLTSIPGDEYCDPCYRVEFETSQGLVPLNSTYTSGSSEKSRMVDKLNSFVHGREPGTLNLTEPGLLSFENFFCFVAWFLIASLSERAKSAFGRRRSK